MQPELRDRVDTAYKLGRISDVDVPLKPSNPKDILGTTRVDLSLVSGIANAEEAIAMTEGLLKYGAYNYRVVGVKTRVYLSAAFRHLLKYLNGENRDKKTGTHHLGSVRACMGIILDAEAQGILIDDRPPSNPNFSDMLDALEARVKHLRELFATQDPKHYTIDDTPTPVKDEWDFTAFPGAEDGPDWYRCEFESGGFGRCVLKHKHEGNHVPEIQVR